MSHILTRIDDYFNRLGTSVEQEAEKLLREIAARYESIEAKVDDAEIRIRKAQAALRGE